MKKSFSMMLMRLFCDVDDDDNEQVCVYVQNREREILNTKMNEERQEMKKIKRKKK